MVIYMLLFYKRFLIFLLILFLSLFLIFLLNFVHFVALIKFPMTLNGLVLNKTLLMIYKKCFLLLLIFLSPSVKKSTLNSLICFPMILMLLNLMLAKTTLNSLTLLLTNLKSNDDIYKQAFKSLPKSASSDSSIRKMYANRSLLLWQKIRHSY